MRIGTMWLVLVVLGRPALAEPGHRGPVLGAGLAIAEDAGAVGEAVAGFAHRWAAAALWIRAATNPLHESTDEQLAFGLAARAWSVWGGWADVGERLYLEGRIGRNRRTIADFEGDLHEDTGAIIGFAVGVELARTAPFSIDLRAGGDHTRVHGLDGVDWWVGLAATFY